MINDHINTSHIQISDHGFAIMCGPKPLYCSGDIGSIGIVIPSMLKSKRSVGKTRSSAKDLSQITYNQFIDAAGVTNDEFWKGILIDGSRGKFPRKFLFDGNMLHYRCRNKRDSVQIPTGSPENVYNIVHDFLSRSADIFSPAEMVASKKEDDDYQRTSVVEINSWEEIKSFKEKVTYVDRFISLAIDKMELKANEWVDMKTRIMLGITSGIFNGSNIFFKDGQISDIGGLIYTGDRKIPGDFIISNDLITNNMDRNNKKLRKNVEEVEDFPPRISNSSLKSRFSVLKSWDKFLETIEKKVAKKFGKTSFAYSDLDLPTPSKITRTVPINIPINLSRIRINVLPILQSRSMP